MKASIKSLFFASIVAVAAVNSSWAQDNTAGPSNGFVVVLDVAKVFNDNQPFDAALKSIQQEAEQFKADIEGRQQALQAEAAKVMEQFKPGTPEFQREETRLEQSMAALRTSARQKNTELLNKEAKLYYDTYQKMQQVVAGIAQENNIDLVLRFDSSQIDQSNRADVIKAVNRGVVYQENLDITSMVSERMAMVSSAGVITNQK